MLEFLFLENCRSQAWSFIENKPFRQGSFPVNFVKFLRTHFYRAPPVVASSYNTLKKNKIILSSFSLLRFAVHDHQLIQEMCFLLLVYYMGLCTGRSKKKTTVRFFRRALKRKVT